MFLLSVTYQGELETWCLGARFKDGHGNGHLYGMCRDHHPGICCLKSLHRWSCVWGTNFQSHIGCILIWDNSNIGIVKVVCDDFPECCNLCFYLGQLQTLSHTYRPTPDVPWIFCGRRDRETAIWWELPSTSTLESGCAEVRQGERREIKEVWVE